MAQPIVSARWTPVLLEAAENVRTRVRKALLSKPSLDINGLKKLLDDEAQQAIRQGRYRTWAKKWLDYDRDRTEQIEDRQPRYWSENRRFYRRLALLRQSCFETARTFDGIVNCNGLLTMGL